MDQVNGLGDNLVQTRVKVLHFVKGIISILLGLVYFLLSLVDRLLLPLVEGLQEEDV